MLDNIIDRLLDKVSAIFTGWIPDWVWTIINFWPWIIGSVAAVIVISILYRVYRIGGWPGLAAAIGALGTAFGYWLGTRTTKHKRPVEPTPSPSKRKTKHRPTLTDLDGDGIPNQQDKD